VSAALALSSDPSPAFFRRKVTQMKKTNAKIGSSEASDNVQQNVVWVPIEELKPYDRNARTHDDKQLAVIAASITTFGFTNPVLVDKNNIIVAGHGRIEAAKRLGYTDALLSELHRTWARPEAADLAQLYGLVAPNYAAVMESYMRAQQAANETA